MVSILAWCAAMQELHPAYAESPERPTIDLSGFAIPSKQIDVACARGGIIEKVLVEEGAHVSKGDPIVQLRCDLEAAKLDVSEARAAAATANVEAGKANVEAATARAEAAQATLELSEVEFARTETLYDEGRSSVATKSDYDKAALDVRLAQLRVRLAQLDVRLAEIDAKSREDQERILSLTAALDREILEEMTITTPVDGEVLQVYKREGEAVEEHAALVKVVDVDNLDVVAFAPLDALPHITVGTTGRFVVKGASEQEVPCEVYLVDAVGDAASQTFRIKAKMDNSGRLVRAGVKGKLRLETSSGSEERPDG